MVQMNRKDRTLDLKIRFPGMGNRSEAKRTITGTCSAQDTDYRLPYSISLFLHYTPLLTLNECDWALFGTLLLVLLQNDKVTCLVSQHSKYLNT